MRSGRVNCLLLFLETMTRTLRSLQTIRQCLPLGSFLTSHHTATEHTTVMLSRVRTQNQSYRIMCTNPESKDKGYIYINNKMSSEAIENSAWVCTETYILTTLVYTSLVCRDVSLYVFSSCSLIFDDHTHQYMICFIYFQACRLANENGKYH